MNNDVMILAENKYYSLDCFKTKLNNNVIAVGTSGAGKTRCLVEPNILQAVGSYIISDPKGNLYEKYKSYLSKKGYRVIKLDFTNPKNSEKYNFFKYIHSPLDILKISNILIYQSGRSTFHDPYWDRASQILIQSLIGFLIEQCREEDMTLENIFRLIDEFNIDEDNSSNKTLLDELFEDLEKDNHNSYAVKAYKKFRCAPGKTLKCIVSTLNATLGSYDTPEINEMLSKDTIDISSIGCKKTALFVVVSDIDRSMDGLANIFFTQALSELLRYADNECKNNMLPIPTRFILDDFATNVRINDFPRMISSIRSRRISAMIMIQSESQLMETYHYDGNTIISNCDTYIYMGGNDIETARAISLRCDIPLKKILLMPVGTNWIFRRGQEPVNARNFDIDNHADLIYT
ncbi:MAG: type IV secretory system conjugative DNA transfer family protein [Lachnospiraceae bacterium]|nr:type IV secretory system conjugative DNA transfer family protein [Lachnospiraceae bacterium]